MHRQRRTRPRAHEDAAGADPGPPTPAGRLPAGTASGGRPAERLVWYVAYGSNMLARRLRYYLAGGQPPGARRRYPGARDTSPPRAHRPVLLDGGVYFALESPTWTGGLALYDRQLPGTAAGRAYLITAGQFIDLAAQEMHRPPGYEVDIDRVVAAGRLSVGDGRYETIVHTGTGADGIPAVTFTAPWHAHQARPNPPALRYLSLLVLGLREAHGWSAERILGYLRRLPGVRYPLARLAVHRALAGDTRPP